MVVASTLMSMGMMMLPPTTISMPFKILLFIIADGWNLVIGNLVKTFYHQNNATLDTASTQVGADLIFREKRVNMTEQQVIDIMREALFLVIKCSAPLLHVSQIVGLIISIIQTITSIQEQTLTFVPKIIAVFLTLMLLAGWIGNNLTDFMNDLWGSFNTLCGF